MPKRHLSKRWEYGFEWALKHSPRVFAPEVGKSRSKLPTTVIKVTDNFHKLRVQIVLINQLVTCSEVAVSHNLGGSLAAKGGVFA